MGAIHGDIGVLYMIIKTFALLKEQHGSFEQDETIIKNIRSRLERLMKLVNEDEYGNKCDCNNHSHFTKSRIHDSMNVFCHGLPGTVPLFTLAAQVFPDLSPFLIDSAI